MASLNKVFLMGNLTRDPELRYTSSGTAVANFGMAINRRWTSPDGQERDETCFVELTIYGRRAEVICEYLTKGSPLFVEGRLQLDQWEDQNGQKRSRLRVVVENFEFIGRGGGAGGGRGAPGAGRPPDEGGAPPVPEVDDVPF